MQRELMDRVKQLLDTYCANGLTREEAAEAVQRAVASYQLKGV